MFQNLDSIAWPSWNQVSTLTVHFRGRSNAGTGAFTFVSAFVQDFPDNILIVSPGRDNGLVSLSAIYDSIVQAILNYGIASWYSPSGGLTVEAAIKAAFDEFGNQLAVSTNGGIEVLFDGQFGRVLVSQA